MIQNIKGIEQGYNVFTEIQPSGIGTPQGIKEFIEESLQIHSESEDINQGIYGQKEDKKSDQSNLGEMKKDLSLSREEAVLLKSLGYDIEHLSAEEVSFLKKAFKDILPKQEEALPEKDETIKRLSEKLETISKQKDGMFLASLKEEGPITIDTLYQDSFKGTAKQNGATYTEEQLTKVLEMNRLDKNKDNLWAAKKLIENQVEVNQKNIVKLQNIKSVVEKLQSQDPKELSAKAPLISGGKILYSEEDIGHIKTIMNHISDEALDGLINRGEPVTLKAIRSWNSGDYKVNEEGLHNNSARIEELRQALNQINELLTSDRASLLSGELSLENTEVSVLSGALQGVVETEAKTILEGNQLPMTNENIKRVVHTLDVKRVIEQNPQQADRMIASRQGAISLAEIKRYIEGGQKVEASFVDGVVNSLLEDLTPQKIGVLLKSGVDPCAAEINDLLGSLSGERLKEFKNGIGDLIEALHAKETLTKQQEEELVKFYKVIDTVQKNEEQVKGYLLKNHLPLSMEHLVEAVEYLTSDNKDFMGQPRSYTQEDIKSIKEDLRQVGDEEIYEVLSSNKPITIGNLREALYRNTQAVLGPTILSAGAAVKDQIQQICAKLTSEAAQKISASMPLESMELAKLVQELNSIENETIHEALQAADVPPTQANVETVKNTMYARSLILENQEETAALQERTNEQLLLREIHEALSSYGANETPTERRFGETIAKVQDQIQDFLQRENIEDTKENVQAAKALVLNNLDITKENIEKVVPMIEKIDAFLEEMTPERAASFIKEGLNPYNASVDTILNWAEKEKVPELKTSLAEAIVTLEDKGVITKEQKESMLGLYRILSSVQENKENVMGYLYKNDLPMTIEKLSEAAKYIGNNTHIDARIDHSFGELENLKYDEKTARTMIGEAKAEIGKVVQLAQAFERMDLPVTEDNINGIKSLEKSLYPLIKDTFKSELGSFEGMDTLPPSFLEKLDQLKNMNPEIIRTLTDNQIPVTMANLYWGNRLEEKPKVYAELMKSQNMIPSGFPKDIRSYKNQLGRTLEKAEAIKQEAIQKGDMLSYRNAKQIEEIAQLQQEFIDKEVSCQIPFTLDGETKVLNLHFKKKVEGDSQKENGTYVTISYETKNLGTIKADIEIEGDSIRYKLYGATKEIAEKLRKEDEGLKELIGQLGYKVKANSYTTEINSRDPLSMLRYKNIGVSQFEFMG